MATPGGVESWNLSRLCAGTIPALLSLQPLAHHLKIYRYKNKKQQQQ